MKVVLPEILGSNLPLEEGDSVKEGPLRSYFIGNFDDTLRPSIFIPENFHLQLGSTNITIFTLVPSKGGFVIMVTGDSYPRSTEGCPSASTGYGWN